MSRFKNWFLYNIRFWRLIELKCSRPCGYYGIERKEYSLYVIKHIITGKILLHDGWGKHLSQESIYNVNKQYHLIKN